MPRSIIHVFLVVLLVSVGPLATGQEPTTVAADPASELTYSLAEVEALALEISPSVAALRARVKAARWECVQAGLPPNPTIGYGSTEIGNDGTAGQQGAFVGQKFIRGGKLKYAQAVALREARRLEQLLAAERLRVLTDTRTAYYDVALAQRQLDLTVRLVDLSGQAADLSRQLAAAGDARRIDVLQAEIENQRATAAQRQAMQSVDAAWRALAALSNLPFDEPLQVTADFDSLLANLAWDEVANNLLATSPQVAARQAAIEKARCVIAQERAAVVPDVTTQLSVQYDYGTNDTFAGVQVGLPLPIWNRNQGGIGRARSELTAAYRDLSATEQALARQLAEVFGRNQAALANASLLRNEILPRADENLRLAREGYSSGELGYLEMLTVQRTYFQVSLEYITALQVLNETSQLIGGKLLSGSGPGAN